MRTYIRKTMGFLKKERTVLGVAAVGLLTILFFNGLLPGQIDSYASRIMSYGAMSCGAYDTENLLRFRCGLVGGEAGGLYTIGYPFVLVSALLYKFLPFLGHAGVTFILTTAIFALSLFALFKISRRIGINKHLAVIAGIVYLISPIIISLSGFGGTKWGMVLLPLYVYVPIFCIDKFAAGAYRDKTKVAKLAALWISITVVAIFMDGYSYIMSQTVVATIGLVYLLSHRKRTESWVSAGIFGVSNVIAYVLFTNLVPAVGKIGGEPIDFFRAMGADLISFVVPATKLWWNEGYRLGSATLWGDGTNNQGNFLGFILITATIIGVILYTKQRNKKNSWLMVGILLSLVIAFLLSLGPSVKINNTKDFDENNVSRKSYIMPRSEANLTLPTEKVFTSVPGLRSMRATYRWNVVTMFTMILIAFYGLDRIHRKGHSKVSIAIAIAVLIEFMPNPQIIYARTTTAQSQRVQFDNDIIKPLGKYLNSDDKVIFMPSSGNDYLASYLAASLKVHTQNLGNDKALQYARKFRSAELNKLYLLKPAEYTEAPDLVRRLIATGEATVVVAQKFSLRWDAYRWPPASEHTGKPADKFAEVLQSNGFNVQSEKYFYVIREADD